MKYEITAEQNCLLKLLSTALFDTEIEKNNYPEITDDSLLYEESKSQGVTGPVFSAIEKLKYPISEEIYKKFFLSAAKISFNNSKLLEIQDKAVKIFDDNNIPYVVLKGSGISMLYKDSSLRMTSDIDILVSKDDFERAENFLLQAGFAKGKNDEGDVHSTLNFDGTVIELHKNINGLPKGELGEKIKKEFSKINDISVIASLDGHSFNILKPEYSVIVILLHEYEHLCSGGIGLRHIADHAVFAEKYLSSDSEYNQTVLKKVIEFKMFDFASIMTKTAIKMFSLDENNFQWCKNAEIDGICIELISDIFEGGLYGRKKSEERYLSGLLVKDESKNSSAIVRLFKHLTQASRRVMPICKKIVLLYPVAIVYISIRYFVRVITGKRKKSNLSGTYRSSVKRHRLYRKFNMFEK